MYTNIAKSLRGMAALLDNFSSMKLAILVHQKLYKKYLRPMPNSPVYEPDNCQSEM
jgi:hypothetical protein